MNVSETVASPFTLDICIHKRERTLEFDAQTLHLSYSSKYLGIILYDHLFTFYYTLINSHLLYALPV